jgi:hypothetical protein
MDPEMPYFYHQSAKLKYSSLSTYKFAVKKMAVFWVVVSCSLVEVYQRFRCSYCLHHQGDAHRPDDGDSKDL